MMEGGGKFHADTEGRGGGSDVYDWKKNNQKLIFDLKITHLASKVCFGSIDAARPRTNYI